MTGAAPRLAPVRLLWVLAAASSCGATCSRSEVRQEERHEVLTVDAGVRVEERLSVVVDREEARTEGPTHSVTVVEQFGPPVVVEQPDGGTVALPGPLASRTTRTSDTGPSGSTAHEHSATDAAATAVASVSATRAADSTVRADLTRATRWGPPAWAWVAVPVALLLVWLAWRRWAP